MSSTYAVPDNRAVHRGILRAAGSIAVAGLVVKLAATGKEFIVAALYGRSDGMDAFLVAFLLPNLLINLIAESMNQALVPTLIRIAVQKGHEAAQQLLSSALIASCGLLTVVALGMGALARLFFPLLGSNFGLGKLDLAVRLFYLLLPVVVLSGIASNGTAVLNATGEFGMPALVPIVLPVATVAGAVLFHRAGGIWALAYATLAGAAIHAALIVARMEARGFHFHPRWYGRAEGANEVAAQFGPVLLSSLVASGGLLLDQAMAGMLPAGSVSALVFAGRFVSVVVTLLAGAVASALVPFFSRMIADGDWVACRSTLRSWVRLTGAVSIPLALLFILGAKWLVRLTLQHGAFGPRDTAVVAGVLAMYALQIPFFVVSRVFYRFIVAMRRTDLVLYCGMLNLALDAALNVVLMRVMGVAGIALATSLWTVSTLGFLAFWAMRLLDRAERGQELVGGPGLPSGAEVIPVEARV